MAKMTIRYVKQYVDQHGKPKLYLRLPGQPLVRLPVDSVDDPKFVEVYDAALNGDTVSQPTALDKAVKLEPPKAGTFRALVADYLGFVEGDPDLNVKTKYEKRRQLEATCRMIIKTKRGDRLFGDVPLELITPQQIQQLLDARRATPEDANQQRKVLRVMYNWATEASRKKAPSNPVIGTKPIKSHSEGHLPWLPEHIARFVERHPPGTKAFFAAAMIFYTSGSRIGDIVRFGRQHVSKDGTELVFTQQKAENRKHRRMTLAIPQPLRELLAAVPPGQLTFLVTATGRPFTAHSFGKWFHKRCLEAGLDGYSAHGLRGGFMTWGVHLGLTSSELAALAGHATLKQAEVYIKARDTELLSRKGGQVVAEGLVSRDPFKVRADGNK